ncbi:MAG: hypothetical protein LBK44_06280, partial [Spirochaetales bacterium]|nr:hypothetical protein [Spirochaetales bacterium]
MFEAGCPQVKKICAHFWRGSAKNRAFRSNSSDLLMQILWDFRSNPGCRGEQRIFECKFAT